MRTAVLSSTEKPFQSTHSVRSATQPNKIGQDWYDISIHALRAECDPKIISGIVGVVISIHALRAECDSSFAHTSPNQRYFNPRTPCGVRRLETIASRCFFAFQSTHSVRSATGNDMLVLTLDVFQSTHSVRSATLYIVYDLSHQHKITIILHIRR